MWGLLIILAGSPMPQPITWHMTHEACQRQAAIEVMHAAAAGRGVLHVECRSYVLISTRPSTQVEILR